MLQDQQAKKEFLLRWIREKTAEYPVGFIIKTLILNFNFTIKIFLRLKLIIFQLVGQMVWLFVH